MILRWRECASLIGYEELNPALTAEVWGRSSQGNCYSFFMKRLFSLALLISSTALAAPFAPSSSPRCEAIKSAVLPGVQSEKEVLRKIGASDFKVLLFGESNHDDFEVSAHRLDLLKRIQSKSQNKIDCVLMELPRDLQPRIEAVLNGKSTVDDLIQSLRPTIAGVDEASIAILQDRMKHLLSPAFQFAIDKKIRLIAIDDLQSNMETQEGGDYEIGKRNALFNDEIVKLFKNNTCKRAVFIIGAAHISSTSENLEYQSLNQWMKASNLASISLFSSTVNNPHINPLPEISSCGIEIGQNTGANFGTQVNKKSKNVTLLPVIDGWETGFKGWSLPLYQDFDFLLFNY